MRRYTFYIAIALAAFMVGLFVVAFSWYKIDGKNFIVEDPLVKETKRANAQVKQAESLNKGFEEISNARDGDVVTVQGFIDQKFLCRDVTDLQPNVCSTVIGNARGDKSVLIRLKTCGDQDRSNCIVWNPGDLCSGGDSCSNQIRIYDYNSKFVELAERVGVNSFITKNVQLKVAGSVSVEGDRARLASPIEKLEIAEVP